ncbi:MAG: aminotransferase class V-fold PLP-dependent enzyme [Clostridia bacterium]|nr:aminotransferase class V-fold PLP-dependent enzyme [Clostridia bacterium]
MIYLDHAATSYPKSPAVMRAVHEALRCYGANPGRGGYPMAMAASEQLYRCRETAAALFDMTDERRVVLTPSCTQALNLVLHSLLAHGGRALTSDMEHNAVMRPLHALCPHRIDVAPVTVGDDDATVEAFRRRITPYTRVLVCTHASNVIGNVLPIARLAALAHANGIPIVVDAAQSAGHVPLRVETDALDYVCVAGHKGLGGPMGTGLLLCRDDTPLLPLIYGGTGHASLSLQQPPDLPERLESGTPNVAGFCGLRAGMDEMRRVGVEAVARRETELSRELYERLDGIRGVRLHSPYPQTAQTVSVLSVTVDDMDTDTLASALAACGVAVRGGLHCAPAAHRHLGTLPLGTVRLSVGVTNTPQEMRICAEILKKIAANPLHFG